jgi:DnaK suppressor protein
MATSRRTQTIRRQLEQRKRELTAEMQGMRREARQTGRADYRGADEQDAAVADQRSDIDLAVMQMKAETVARIDTALRRLDQGTHGNCVECGEKISLERLAALPFALRCRNCEQSREKAATRRAERPKSLWRDSSAGGSAE